MASTFITFPFTFILNYRERFGYKGGEFPVAEAAYERLLSLPMFPAMTDADVDDVVRAMGKVLQHYAS